MSEEGKEMKRYKLPFKSLAIVADSSKKSHSGINVIVDGEDITRPGSGIRGIYFMSEAPDEYPYLVIEGKQELMIRWIAESLIDFEN